MSTKTLRKRIALVAVSALGFGVVSAVPSSAANYITPTNSVTAINAIVSSTPALLIPGSTVTVNYGATFGAYTVPAQNDGSTVEHSFVGELIAYPASAYSQVTSLDAATAIAKTGTAAAVALSHLGGRSFLTATETATSGTGTTAWGFAAQTVTATATSGLGAFSFTAAVPGTYTLRIWSDHDQNNQLSANEMVKTVDVTVATPSTYSNSYSTSFIGNGNGTTAATADGTVLAAKAISNANAGFITVTLKDATNAAMTAAAGTLQDVTAVRVTSTGVGFVAAKTTAGVPVSGTGSPEASICQTVANNAGGGVIGGLRTTTIAAANITSNVLHFYACADNTGGFGEIKVEVISTSGGVQTLATEKVAYYGDVTTLTKTEQLGNWLKLGGTTGDSTTPAYKVSAKDANGIAVPGLTLTSTSSNSAKWTSAQVAAASGEYWYSITTTTLAPNATVAGDKPVFTIADSVVTTAKVDVTGTVSGAPSTVVLAMGSSYDQGDVVTLTISARDALNNPVSDLTAHALLGTAGLVSNIMLQGATATAGGGTVGIPSTANVTTVAGNYTWTFFAPVSKNGFTIANSTGGAYTIASVSASYANPEADLAAEALDAANAAIDAANAASEAADAATAAAQDAADAVAALATQVATYISNLRKQITALTNLVVKIQKKVKA
jgi:hypothetical protein